MVVAQPALFLRHHARQLESVIAMSTSDIIRVFIRDWHGHYLSTTGGKWSLTTERALAHVFDYHADSVDRQLEQAQRDLGVVWVAVPLDPCEVGETCDSCSRKLPVREVFFDDTFFLCPVCRAN